MPARKRLSPNDRLRLLERVFKEGSSVSQACNAFRVSRFTFYRLAKRFLKDASGEVNLSLVLDRYRRGSSHHRSVPHGVSRRVIEHIRKDPGLSVHKLAQITPGIGSHGTQLLLEKLGLRTRKDREHFAKSSRSSVSQRLQRERVGIRRTLTALERLVLLKRAVNQGEPISKLAREAGISRFTLYLWLKRYREQPTLEGLGNRWVFGRRHYRATPEVVEQRVLEEIIRDPSLSSHRLAKKLAVVGNHGVQNVLFRYGLNTFEKRLAYARLREAAARQAQAVRPELSWLGRLKQVFEQFVPTRAPAGPPPGLRPGRPAAPGFVPALFSLLRFSPSLLFLFLILIGSFQWGRFLGIATSTTQALGWAFASLALGSGTLFFLYSLKYYFTLAVVLSFSREAQDSTEDSSLKTQDSTRDFSFQSSAFRSPTGWLGRVFGIGMMRGEGLGSRVEGGGEKVLQTGLEPDVSQVKLERYPFISIHLPIYNEPKVVERLLRACTSFTYEGSYEVVVADDSTDETTGIVERFLKGYQGESRVIKGNQGEEILHVTPSAPDTPSFTLIHRADREGFKGGALKEALKATDPRAEFIVVFDADFVPYPDTLELFLKYFQVSAGSLARTKPGSRVERGRFSRLYPKPSPLYPQPYCSHPGIPVAP